MLTTASPTTTQTLPLSAENYALLQKEVHRHSGIVLDDSKLYLMESRLLPLVKEERLGTLNDLCQLLRAGSRPALLWKVVETMTTNETLFFRDQPAFDALQKQILPELLERRKSVRRLSIWSAASSTGQEAYSIAMLLLELGVSGWDIRLLGTDLNSQVLERARTGRFL